MSKKKEIEANPDAERWLAEDEAAAARERDDEARACARRRQAALEEEQRKKWMARERARESLRA